ncbi:MAG TPA: 23S rRNA (pseudouridine(1915)-N(3))-methyltransferase RlmH [Methylomirabilota bacterium]|jgi:23S rRNA (pseudouridine1915-N3)-methyltransferase|nr:23S rRNA (pseudouridine(1915)-N(3))-methyltransferase RlmH [Methylomirabilota bacterium]
MKLGLVAVGRMKAGPLPTLFQDYARRLAWPLLVVEVEERRPLPAAELKEREGALILDALANSFRKAWSPAPVALDQRGAALDSRAFAERLARWRDAGADPVFVIGGADGLSPGVLERMDATLSLGPMTWPHQLVRVLLAEQLFRAQSILAGHPYHRD